MSPVAEPVLVIPRLVLGFVVQSRDQAAYVKWDQNVTGYEIRWRETSAGYTDSNKTVVGPELETHTVTGLTNDVAYAFQIRALDFAFGPGPWSKEFSVTPVAPPLPDAPGAPVPTGIRGGLKWAWSEPAGNGLPISGYKFEWRQVGGEWSTPALVDGRTATVVNAQMSSTSDYEAHVKAITAAGESDWSAVSTTTRETRPLPPLSSLRHEFTSDATFTWPYSDLSGALMVLRSGTGGAGGGGGGGGGGVKFGSSTHGGHAGGAGGGTDGGEQITSSTANFSRRDGTGRGGGSGSVSAVSGGRGGNFGGSGGRGSTANTINASNHGGGGGGGGPKGGSGADGIGLQYGGTPYSYFVSGGGGGGEQGAAGSETSVTVEAKTYSSGPGVGGSGGGGGGGGGTQLQTAVDGHDGGGGMGGAGGSGGSGETVAPTDAEEIVFSGGAGGAGGAGGIGSHVEKLVQLTGLSASSVFDMTIGAGGAGGAGGGGGNTGGSAGSEGVAGSAGASGKVVIYPQH